MNMPHKYWGESVRSAAYLMNQTPYIVIEFKTPLQKAHELVDLPIKNSLDPNIFGCTAYVHQNIRKLEPRAIRCIFLGYANEKKSYRCNDPVTDNMHVNHNVLFHETVPLFGSEGSLQGEKKN